MRRLPTVLIPQQIQRVNEEMPPIPTLSLQQPSSPGKEPKKVNTTVIAVEAAVAVPSVAIVSQGKTGAGLFLLLFAMGAIAAHAWRQMTTYPQRKQEYRQKIQNYTTKLDEYDRGKRQHEADVRAARSPERVAEFHYNLLLNVLRQTVPNDGTNSNAPSGAAEANFSNYLKRYFPGKIHTKLSLSIPNFEHPYTPDFAYIDQALNLYIDIEIDEPYTYRTREPTHFTESWKDNNRNTFFLDNGWIVIRFSEEQVVRWPQSCCKVVADTKTRILGGSSIMSQFSSVSDLTPMERWTESEARLMADRRYRDTYLS